MLRSRLQKEFLVKLTLIREIGQHAPIQYSSFDDVIEVPAGTKLSKLKSLAPLAGDEVVSICDMDMDLNIDTAVTLVAAALKSQQTGKPIVAFGVIEAWCGSSMLGKVLAFDKWISHRVIRPALWNWRIGVTLPGQFVVVPAAVINAVPAGLDTYLDDLCLGLVAREAGIDVCRSSIVVGSEEGRCGWAGLLMQRLRWMKGFMSLLAWHRCRPKAILFLLIHFVTYHAVPMLLFLVGGILLLMSPIYGAILLLLIASCGAYASGQPTAAVLVYMLVFPLLHAIVSTLFWLPVPTSFLRKR